MLKCKLCGKKFKTEQEAKKHDCSESSDSIPSQNLIIPSWEPSPYYDSSPSPDTSSNDFGGGDFGGGGASGDW